MKIGFYLDGGEQLAQNLATLDARLRRNVITTAVRRSQQIMLKAAQATARTLPRSGRSIYAYSNRRKRQEQIRMAELLARNIVIAPPKRQIPGSYSVHVQMRRGVKEFVHVSKTGRRSYIPAAIEYGHGSDPASAARPFMRNAADWTKHERMNQLAQELGIGLLREALKGGVL